MSLKGPWFPPKRLKTNVLTNSVPLAETLGPKSHGLLSSQLWLQFEICIESKQFLYSRIIYARNRFRELAGNPSVVEFSEDFELSSYVGQSFAMARAEPERAGQPVRPD